MKLIINHMLAHFGIENGYHYLKLFSLFMLNLPKFSLRFCFICPLFFKKYSSTRQMHQFVMFSIFIPCQFSLELLTSFLLQRLHNIASDTVVYFDFSSFNILVVLIMFVFTRSFSMKESST